MDEKLQTTLNKIVLLCSQNPEFDSALRKRLGINAIRMIPIASNNDKIDQIEKYLGLDYSVDAQNSVIDYSYIKDEKVKNQLISDNREMMRFRYGTRYHEIDFDEFCRFAHLQAEMLLNYYYDTTCNSDLDLIKKHIKKYNATANGVDEARNILAISFQVKMWAFNNEHGTDWQFKRIFNNLVKVRNAISHRSPNKGQQIAFVSDKFDTWYSFKPYDEIIEGLKSLSVIIANATKADVL